MIEIALRTKTELFVKYFIVVSILQKNMSLVANFFVKRKNCEMALKEKTNLFRVYLLQSVIVKDQACFGVC